MAFLTLFGGDNLGIICDRVSWSMFALTAITVTLRILTRVRYQPVHNRGGLGLDDYITIFCLAVYLLSCVFQTIGANKGRGRHFTTLTADEQVIALKWNVIVNASGVWAWSLPKFAVIATLKRILDYGTRTTVLFWGLALTSQGCIFATSVWWFEQCQPIQHGWDPAVPGSCADMSVLVNLGYFTSAYAAFLDIFFALYPVPIIMRLQMPLKTRVAVAIALGLSALACIVSVYKLAMFGALFDLVAADPTYPGPYLDMLGLAEGFVLMVCASVPALGPLVAVARGTVSDAYGSMRGTRKQVGDGSKRSNGGHESSDPWNSFKGNRSDDMILETTQEETRDGLDAASSVPGTSSVRKTVGIPMFVIEAFQRSC